MLAIMPMWMMGQASGGQVTRPAQKPATTTAPKKTTTPAKRTTTAARPAAEAAGYDVTFSSNVPSATLYIDGTANGTASGTRFLKTGSHTVKLIASGYQNLERTITVNSRSRSFTLTMTPEPTRTQSENMSAALKSTASSYSSSSSSSASAGGLDLHDMLLKPLGHIDANPWADSFATVKSRVSTRYIVDDSTDADDQKLYVWGCDDANARALSYHGMELDYYFFAINTDKDSSIDRRVKYQFKLPISRDPYPYLDKIIQDYRALGVNLTYTKTNETYTKAKGSYREGKVDYDIELTKYSTEWSISMNVWRFY